VVGKIKISDGAVIGACFFIEKDVPAETVVTGITKKSFQERTEFR